MAGKKMDPTKLQTIYSSLFDELNQLPMRILHRTWFRNILYYLGEQWFEWVRGQNTFRRIVPNAYPKFAKFFCKVRRSGPSGPVIVTTHFAA